MVKPLRIIYLGTPDFAVPPLRKLVENGFEIVGVITAPDRPAGRGLQLQMSPVKQYALEQGIKVLQPERLKNPDFLNEVKDLNADLQIVVAFRMMPEALWNMPYWGTFNLHASLLPDYRGAAPINWAIINGEETTGLTTFFLKHEIDTGDIILQKELPIGHDETAGELHDRLSLEGAELVLQTAKMIQSGDVKTTPQPKRPAKEAPKIFKDDCKIDWSKPLDSLHNFIRGLSPYPAAWTTLDGKVFKIYKAKKRIADHLHPTGKLISEGGSVLAAAKGGYLELVEIQIEGKKRMPASEFIKGYGVEGKVLS